MSAIPTPTGQPGWQRRAFGWLPTEAAVVVAVAGLTLLGLAIRIANFDQALIGDELSSYWIVGDHSLGEVLSSVRSDDEITPPLFFILGWLSVQPDWGPEWIRLPSLVAGTLTIPLVYLLGARTIGRAAGLIGAAVITLSPFMIYYSTEARAYSLMIALLVGSTLALLAAAETGRTRWWVVYAACSCAAMLSHYTAAFPLAAQFAWAIWAHRESLRPLLLANVAALVGFSPWIPGFIADNNSPTTEILAALSPLTFESLRTSIESWAVGYPYLRLDYLPGNLARGLILAGIVVAAVTAAARGLGYLRQHELGFASALRRVPAPVVLIALLALAAPVGETIFSAVASDILGARNLNPSWPGLAVAIGGVMVAAGPLLGAACTVAVLSGFIIGTTKALGPDAARVDYRAAAELIEQRWEPGDVVVDAATLTPVPLTGLDVFLPQTNPEFRLDLPVSDRPFMPFDPVPDPSRQIEQALASASGGSVFLVKGTRGERLASPVGDVKELRERREDLGAEVLRRARQRFRIVSEAQIPGLAPLRVFELKDRNRSGPSAGRQSAP